jgi:DNA-binding SARP family transcriptional activator/tetratricopeptide (TPR) repeat protein
MAQSRRVYLFGSLRVDDDLGLRRVGGEKVQSLLAYLVLHPRIPHRRELLADLLSPEASPQRVRRNFSDTLYRLQKALTPEWLAIDAETVALASGADLWVDVWEFERLADSGLESNLQQAADLYTGDLLPAIYADWILPERELRRNQYLAILENLAALQEAKGELKQTLLTLRRLVSAEPLHEPAHQAYLRVLGRLQRFGEAQAHYEYLRRLTQIELNAEPLAETRAIIQSIERERDLASVPIEVDERVKFVGRISERGAALAAVEAAIEGQGSIVAIEGEAGIGKSRLLREIMAGASWRGATVLHGNASQVPSESPFTPLMDALSPFLNSARAAQLESLLPAEILSTLTPLFPVWGERMQLPETAAVRTGKHLQNALRFFGETLAQLGPLLLALDDLHWADPVLWDSLNILSQGLIPNGALLILTYRTPEIEATSGWGILRDWEQAGLLTTLPLQPLNLTDVVQLVGDQAGVEPHEIYSLTGGNPFLISEWLADPALSQARRHDSIMHRLKSLSPSARAALQAAAVLGESVPYQLWAATADIPPITLAGLSEELMARHWLLPSKEGYSFAHDLIRTAIYDDLKPGERRRYHERAAQAYLDLEPDNARAQAFHLDQAGHTAEAAAAYRHAGEQDRDRFAFHEAQAAFERALTLMARLPTLERIEIEIALARVCEITGDRMRQQPALEEALAGARLLGNEVLLLEAQLVMGRAASRTGKIREAESQISAALILAKKLQDRRSETQALNLSGDLSGVEGEWGAARAYYIQALQLAREIPAPVQEASALRGIAIAARQMGDPQESAKWLEQCREVNRRLGDRLGELSTQVNILSALYELGDWDRLIGVADEAIPAAEALGSRYTLARMRQNRGLAAYALGDYATARQLLGQAERDCEAVGDLHLAGLVRNTLGLVAEDEGNFEEALHLYRTALANAKSLQASTEGAYAQHDLGALLLRLGQPLDAIPLLEAARDAWSRQENLLLRIKSEAFLGLAMLAADDRTRAEELAARSYAVFQAGVPKGEQPQGWLWALYRLLLALERREPARAVLRTAFEEVQRRASAIKDADRRSQFLERVPLNHAIMEAYQQTVSSARVVSVSLARRDAPLGRALKPDEKIVVQWTVSAAEDEAIPDRTQLRRVRLKRLLQQAEIQGGAPTDDDLARALGVSRRTILRDLQAMAQEITTPPTRKRGR